MVSSAIIMALEQHDLVELSRYYQHTAEAIEGSPIPQGRIQISDIEIKNNGRIKWAPAGGDRRPLSGLALILKLGDIPTFRGDTDTISRRNVATVARIGSLATLNIHLVSKRNDVPLSPQALRGLQITLVNVHEKMEGAFVPVEPEPANDAYARVFLNSAARLLSKQD